MLMKIVGMAGLPGAITFVIALIGAVAVAYGAAKLIAFLSA